MLDSLSPAGADPAALLPRPPMPERVRSQLESFLVLRRNPLELWGRPAYRELVLPGRFLGRPQLVLNDPAAIRHVLLGNHTNYQRTEPTRRVLRPVLGEGLFLAEGERWRQQRRVISPALAPRVLPVLARHVASVARDAEERIAVMRGRPMQLMPVLQRLTLDVAGRSMFSLEMERFGDRLRGLLTRYGLNLAKVGLLDLLAPTQDWTPLARAREAFRRDWLGLMDAMIEARASQPGSPDRPRDLFDLLEAARDGDTGASIGRDLLRDEVSTLILAGHETTAVALFWACYVAARLPEHQDAILAEAETAGDALEPDGAGAVLDRLPRTRAFLDETLRLYPPAYLVVREAMAADRIGDLPVEPGTVISISPWLLHRHERFWDRPERFDPDRFAPGRPPPDRMVYMPFGAGPRICVGMQFALAEAVLVLARLVRRFRIELPGRGEVVPRAVVTTQPDRLVPFRLVSRRG
ncbi:cytochrome P450 [Rhizosaccharibacter radicis]|uniref:Cytochrome P450 n=1 Tax=Rhizosaccharibacter radicis TaxID=2782605 RepID=A0ABT1W1A8_9PROT|nr:cytochrome P450 [Acetobacteraceae bacterium KSS12]